MSGTTATLAVHDHRSSKITVAHVADALAQWTVDGFLPGDFRWRFHDPFMDGIHDDVLNLTSQNRAMNWNMLGILHRENGLQCEHGHLVVFQG